MRQNDLQLVTHDIWASAKSMSDIITYEDDADVVPDNFGTYQAKYTKNSWYVRPNANG